MAASPDNIRIPYSHCSKKRMLLEEVNQLLSCIEFLFVIKDHAPSLLNITVRRISGTLWWCEKTQSSTHTKGRSRETVSASFAVRRRFAPTTANGYPPRR